jgi:hypothetical protein
MSKQTEQKQPKKQKQRNRRSGSTIMDHLSLSNQNVFHDLIKKNQKQKQKQKKKKEQEQEQEWKDKVQKEHKKQKKKKKKEQERKVGEMVYLMDYEGFCITYEGPFLILELKGSKAVLGLGYNTDIRKEASVLNLAHIRYT